MTTAFVKRMALERREDSADGGGGWTRGWTSLGRCWVNLSPQSAVERMSLGAEAGRMTLKAIVPWTPPDALDRPRPGFRFRDGARAFEVLAVDDSDPWRRTILCWLAEGDGE